MWAAQSLLCSAREKPCGKCQDCKWIENRQHPDCFAVEPSGDSKFIVVDQIRELLGEFALTSHAGRGKVAILAPAEAINVSGANALLKTLEEPTAGTLLILVTAQPSRLLATIRSRCLKLRLANPARRDAAEWLATQRGQGPWEEALRITGVGPWSLVDADPAQIVATHREVAETLAGVLSRSVEPPAVADSWARADLELKLACTESWITDRVYATVSGQRDSTEVRAATHLQQGSRDLNIRTLIELQSAVRELQALLPTSINKSFAVESLLWRWAQVKK
jgi:DNA polymerase-3 subunit delta'